MKYQHGSRCDTLTDRCEEDSFLDEKGRPICEECFDEMTERELEGFPREGGTGG